MGSRSFLTLVGVVVLLSIVAIFVSVSRQPDRVTSELLLPELEAALNEVEKITVKTAGNRTVATLVRGDERWTVVEASDYPADLGRIRQNLIALSQARIVEEKTSNPELYDQLGVENIDNEDAEGTQLDIEAEGYTASVIIGDTGVSGGDMAYARLTGEPRSVMVNADLNLAGDHQEWLDRDLLDVASSRIHAVTLTHPDGEVLRIEKSTPDATDFTVLNIPDGRELTHATVANPIGAALSSLRLDGVMSSADFAPADSEFVVARVETFNGLIVESRAYAVEDGIRVSFSASAGTPISAEAEELQPDEIATLNQRLGSWIYTLPSYKTDQLTKRMDDLLKAEEEE